MKKQIKEKKKSGEKGTIFGTATIGEKGQVVIPVEARKKLGLKKGQKMLVFAGQNGMLGLANISQVEFAIEELSHYIKSNKSS